MASCPWLQSAMKAPGSATRPWPISANRTIRPRAVRVAASECSVRSTWRAAWAAACAPPTARPEAPRWCWNCPCRPWFRPSPRPLIRMPMTMSEPVGQPRRLLVVEDDEAFARTLVRSFERRGYEVRHVPGQAELDAVLQVFEPGYAVVDL